MLYALFFHVRVLRSCRLLVDFDLDAHMTASLGYLRPWTLGTVPLGRAVASLGGCMVIDRGLCPRRASWLSVALT